MSPASFTLVVIDKEMVLVSLSSAINDPRRLMVEEAEKEAQGFIRKDAGSFTAETEK